MQKAADLFGLGTDAIRWIPVDAHSGWTSPRFERQIHRKIERGESAVPGRRHRRVRRAPARSIRCERSPRSVANRTLVSRRRRVRRARGCCPDAPARCARCRWPTPSPSIPTNGCTRRSKPAARSCATPITARRVRLSPRPTTTSTERGRDNFYERGPQNSRGIRALKVWPAIRQCGRDGYQRMIADDIAMSRAMPRLAAAHPELEALTQSLSISTFRFVPAEAPGGRW